MSTDMQALAALKSWVEYSADSDFPIQNLPYGVFTTANITAAHIGVAIGSMILDLTAITDAGFFAQSTLLKGGAAFKEATLNAFMALGKDAWSEARKMIQSLLLVGGNTYLSDNSDLKAKALIAQADATMLLPARIGDYTDFYASRNHAYNVGVMFRGPDNALQPNWTWLPVGYHGRASSVVVSGTPLRRPCGQLTGPDNAPPPTRGPCRLLDFELEMGFLVGTGNELGEPIDVADAHDKIFGMVLMNDWSARDIQKWEYVPLGPFGAKNFGTTISPWVVTMEALKPFAIKNQEQTPAPLPYLTEEGNKAYNIDLQVLMTPVETGKETKLVDSNTKHLYWTFSQMLAHHSVSGCNMQPGDLLGSGTISGTNDKEFGSMLELSWKGTKTITVDEGVERKFIKDGDIINMRGAAKGDGFQIGFGDCSGKILPAFTKCQK